MLCHQNAGQNHNMKAANASVLCITKFRCLGMEINLQWIWPIMI